MLYATLALAILPTIASAETSSLDYGTMMERMAQSRVGICQIGDQTLAITYGSDSDTTWAAVEGNSSVTGWTVTSASITDGVLTVAGKNEMIRYSGTKVIGLIGGDTIEGTCVDASSPVNRAIASLLPETDPDDTLGSYRLSMIDEVKSLRRSLALARIELAELIDVDDRRIAAQRDAAALNAQVAELRAQLSGLEYLLEEAEARDSEAQVQLDNLGNRLNAALAQVAGEQRARAELEEAERRRLEEEAR